MHRFAIAALTLASCSSFAWAGAETFFEERTHDFGSTPRGPVLIHHFNFTNSGKETLTIGSLRVSCGCVTASAPVTHIKPGESSYITAQMDTRRFTGHKAVTIYVQFSSPRFEEVTFQVKANGRDDFSIYPQSLAFGSVRQGASAKATVQVTLLGDETWKIESLKSESNYIKAEPKLLKRNGGEVTYEITASLQPGLPPGKWISNVWLNGNNTSLGKASIPVSVEITTAVSASPEVLQLGEVKIGDSVEQNVLIRSDKPFRIKAVRGGETIVQVSGLDSEAKKVHVLKFELKPSSAGEIKRSIAIITDDGDEPAVTIPVQAKAVKE